MITYIFVTGYSIIYYFFFFKQKTAYEMRISDWSSDVCSSDLSQELRTKREHTSLFGLVGFKRVAVNAKKREEYVLHIGFIHFRGCLCGGDDHHHRNASEYWHKMISALMFGSQGVSIAPRRKPMRPPVRVVRKAIAAPRSEEHTSELQSLMRISYAV